MELVGKGSISKLFLSLILGSQGEEDSLSKAFWGAGMFCFVLVSSSYDTFLILSSTSADFNLLLASTVFWWTALQLLK